MLAAITCIVCKRSLGWTFGFRQYSSHSRKQRASYWMHAALLRSMGLTISASCAMGALIDLSAAAYCSRRSSTRTLKSSSRPVAHVMRPGSLAWPATPCHQQPCHQQDVQVLEPRQARHHCLTLRALAAQSKRPRGHPGGVASHVQGVIAYQVQCWSDAKAPSSQRRISTDSSF